MLKYLIIEIVVLLVVVVIVMIISFHYYAGYVDESDCWSHEDDEISQQYCQLKKPRDRDTISMMSLDSCDSRELSARGGGRHPQEAVGDRQCS